MLTVRRTVLPGLPGARHTDGDLNELLLGESDDTPRLDGTADLAWAAEGVRNFEGRGLVAYSLTESPGPGKLFLVFEAGIGGRADLGGLRGGGFDGNRVGCGMVDVMFAT